MTEKYVCGICGKSYTDLDEYLDCVSKCGEKFKKERENKRLEEINAAINGVKQAKIYYEQKLKEFKEKYPEEYDMNFGSESSNDCDAKAVKREDIGKIESRMEKENFIMYQLILGEEEYGEKEEELIGFKILHKRKQKKLNYFLLV